jgi:hypothetical protein
MQLRPFAVLGRCWLHEPVELAPDLTVESLGLPLSFEREIDFVLELGEQLGIKPSPEFQPRLVTGSRERSRRRSRASR